MFILQGTMFDDLDYIVNRDLEAWMGHKAGIYKNLLLGQMPQTIPDPLKKWILENLK